MTEFDEPTERAIPEALGTVALEAAAVAAGAPTPTPTPAAATNHAVSTLSLSVSPGQLAAETLAGILGVELTAETAAQMSDANASLLDFRPESLMQTLARNLVVLQAMSMQLMKQGMGAAKYPQAQAALLRTALQAQKETRCVIELMRDLQRDVEAQKAETING